MNREHEPRIVLIVGARRAGKSTLCLKVTERLREAGVRVSGLLTEHVGPHDLDVIEIHTGRRYRITAPFESDAGIAFRHFRLDPAAMRQSTTALEEAFPTQVFLLDELGPMELKFGLGWVRVLTLLKQTTFNIAFLVVRSELLIEALCQLPAAVYTVVRVTERNRENLVESLTQLAISRGA
ncbi:MAG: DUF2478 domain-containing protein [Anaerolineae bacterium]|nr:DUF2478 domain-containing protein [Anaerolineae bacterium]